MSCVKVPTYNDLVCVLITFRYFFLLFSDAC